MESRIVVPVVAPLLWMMGPCTLFVRKVLKSAALSTVVSDWFGLSKTMTSSVTAVKPVELNPVPATVMAPLPVAVTVALSPGDP